MKTMKSLLTVTAITAVLASNSLFAELLPRAAAIKHPSVSSAVQDADFVHGATTIGNAAASKAAGPTVIAAGEKSPNLLGCARIGKATCNANPCDGKMLAACCK
jgi:hypothetical protein